MGRHYLPGCALQLMLYFLRALNLLILFRSDSRRDSVPVIHSDIEASFPFMKSAASFSFSCSDRSGAVSMDLYISSISVIMLSHRMPNSRTDPRKAAIRRFLIFLVRALKSRRLTRLFSGVPESFAVFLRCGSLSYDRVFWNAAVTLLI